MHGTVSALPAFRLSAYARLSQVQQEDDVLVYHRDYRSFAEVAQVR